MSIQHTTAGWARALTAALTATADAALLDAARRLLATGTASLNVNQGFATSKFPLPDGRVARPRLLVDELSPQQWDRIEDSIAAHPDAARIAGTAAISDILADPAHTAGIPLVPPPQDISHTCTCTPDPVTSSPCAHSVATGLLLAERLRTSPAPLFTLRGRPHQHLKNRLRTTPSTAVPRQPPPRTPEPSPASPADPTRPPRTTIPLTPTAAMPEPADLDLTQAHPVLTSALDPPPAQLPDLQALTALAADAAHRAQSLLAGNDTPLCPDTASDLARFIALPHGAPFRQAAMDHLGLDIVAMGHLTLAHTYGGPSGAAAYLEPFAVDHDVLARAQADIQPLRPAPMAIVECEDNRITDTAAGIQLRYGPDGRWYPYRAPYGAWQPVAGPSADPAQAYRAARTAARPRRRSG
ncbi:hypothetical protein [Streptomyces violascens]|uniref:hypothetical protein n=1 Tax=Streptomyces violascens TaxID=67381 RepID=UPI001677BE52|nr:hypothetical protein [Streptomyces violascens]GGU39229.1 hypothetical protein GCM10010289_70180 [Streptomyces violascens]